MRTYYGNYLGIVITGGEKDPEGRGRCQIFIPHIMPALYEGWNREGEDISFDIVGEGLPTALKPEIVETLKKILPWAECAAPVVGASPSTKDGDEIKRNTARAMSQIGGLGPVSNLDTSFSGGISQEDFFKKTIAQREKWAEGECGKDARQILTNVFNYDSRTVRAANNFQPQDGKNWATILKNLNWTKVSDNPNDARPLGISVWGAGDNKDAGHVATGVRRQDGTVGMVGGFAGITNNLQTGGGSRTDRPFLGVWAPPAEVENVARKRLSLPEVNHSAINVDVGINMNPDGETGGSDYELASLNLSEDHKQGLSSFLQNYQNNKGEYEAVSNALKQNGVTITPSQIAAIHWREASGSFNKSIANGETLGKYIRKDGKMGQGSPGSSFTPTNNWVQHSAEVLSYKVTEKYGGPRDVSSSAAFNDFAERYNGLGYRQKNTVSPYVYAGTNLYTGGKFTSDGNYDPNTFDKQVGTAVLAAAADGTLEREGIVATALNPSENNLIKHPTADAGSYGPDTNYQALGMFGYASEGATVWTFFREGSPLFPVYFAASYGQKEWQNMYQHSSQGIGCGDGGALPGTEKMRFNSYGGGFESTQVMENSESGLEAGTVFQIYGKNGSNLMFAADHTEFNSVYNHNQRVSGDFHEITEANKEQRVRGDSNSYIEQDVYVTVGNWSDEAIAASDEIQEYLNESMSIKSGKGSSQPPSGGVAFSPTKALGSIQQTATNAANRIAATARRFTSKTA